MEDCATAHHEFQILHTYLGTPKGSIIAFCKACGSFLMKDDVRDGAPVILWGETFRSLGDWIEKLYPKKE